MAEGIEVRHTPSCPKRAGGGRCRCNPSYRAKVWLPRERKSVRKSFRSLEAAKAWRAEALTAARNGLLRPQTPQKLSEAAQEWLQRAREGTVLNRSRRTYKPAAIRGYEQALRLRVLPALGSARLTDIRRHDVQAMIDTQIGEGLAATTIESGINALRAIYRDAEKRGRVTVNPTKGLDLPVAQKRTYRIASPAEAAALIEAVPSADRPIWATAFYAGLRRGEIRALRFEDVDLAAGVIHVRRGWDDLEGEIPPKSEQGRRRVPIPGVLRDYLDVIPPGEPESLIFGKGRTIFDSRRLIDRANKAWEDAGLERIKLHEARHTFASLMIAAGVNAKALSVFMGHFSITITLDLYGHLMPGSEDEAAALLDAYLDKSREQAEALARDASGTKMGHSCA